MYRSASDLWSKCASLRTGLITRVERYAALTIPKVCYPNGYDSISSDESHDYQSIGAQAVNHLSNKLMLAMFAPSRPFVKLKAGKKARAEATAAGLTETKLEAILSSAEREAVAALDNKGQRPKLFQVMRHLIVAGNVLLVLDKAKGLRVIGIKNFVVKRNIWGEIMHIVIREQLPFDELDKNITKLLRQRYQDDSKVDYFKWIERTPEGGYVMTQWVDEVRLPKEFDGRWPEDSLPYRVITWDLSDESDYGTSLVEEYIGDFEATSTLSESIVDGSVLGTEFRWMVNPNGMTSVDDLNNSENGDALPGIGNDVVPTQGGNPTAITVASNVLDKYERRISRGFLLGSAVIRDAERVTTEEVRLTAQELETAYGGVYSTLAASLQLPVAYWLFASIDLKIANADFKPTIVTGLDALSRNGDLENFRAAMGDMASVSAVPDNLAARMRWEEVASFIGSGRNIDLARFIRGDEEMAKQQQQQQQQQVEQQATTDVVAAAAKQG